MPEIPDYVSREREIEVVVQKPDGTRETFNSKYDHIVFIDVRDEGVWIRDENSMNTFFPSGRIMRIKMRSSGDNIPEHLQKQRRQ